DAARVGPSSANDAPRLRLPCDRPLGSQPPHCFAGVPRSLIGQTPQFLAPQSRRARRVPRRQVPRRANPPTPPGQTEPPSRRPRQDRAQAQGARRSRSKTPWPTKSDGGARGATVPRLERLPPPASG